MIVKHVLEKKVKVESVSDNVDTWKERNSLISTEPVTPILNISINADVKIQINWEPIQSMKASTSADA